jgi:DNA invertase Pin-like site-specific DNA recombinase
MLSEVEMQAQAPAIFISYVRVSTVGQHQSGLGEDAQRMAVASYVRNKGGEVLQEVQETQSGRKGLADRPELARALALCKKTGAALVIGKLDRLARDVRHFLALIDDSGVDIRFADMPDVCPRTDEGRMMLVNMANYAEFEARRIGTRTRAALAAAKARGTQLGAAGPANLRPNIEARQAAAEQFAEKLRGQFEGFRRRGLSQRKMVAELNAVGIKTARGRDWQLAQVQRVLARLSGFSNR